MSFWQQLPKPFFVLAPMDDVTDVIFRQVVTAVAPPEVLFTEFVATDGLQSAGRERTLERLRIEPDLKIPLVAQIWGDKPDNYLKSAQDIADMGFSGIDINFGCPERGIVARGCCGGMIGRNALAAEIIAATKAGAPNLPISVKTRLGVATNTIEEWAPFLLEQNLAALTIHGRTVREMSKVPAHWDQIARVVAMRDNIAPHTLIIGNGDVENRQHGEQRAAQTGVDGVMIGRGIFHDIYSFAPQPVAVNPSHRIQILLDHLDRYDKWGSNKPFHILKKFFKIYVSDWPGAAEFRAQLMDTTTTDEVRKLIKRSQQPII